MSLSTAMKPSSRAPASVPLYSALGPRWSWSRRSTGHCSFHSREHSSGRAGCAPWWTLSAEHFGLQNGKYPFWHCLCRGAFYFSNDRLPEKMIIVTLQCEFCFSHHQIKYSSIREILKSPLKVWVIYQLSFVACCFKKKHSSWNLALQFHLREARAFCLNITVECCIPWSYTNFSYTINIWLSFIDRVSNISRKVAN